MYTMRALKQWFTLGPVVLLATSVFLLLEMFGGLYPAWMRDDQCLHSLGCNAGFFGYDAVVHFVSGIGIALVTLWLAERFPKYNLFQDGLSKNIFIVTSVAAFCGVVWEMFEFSCDHFRMAVLHAPLGISQPPFLAQPSNADTIGDLTLGLSGVLLTLLLVWLISPTLLDRRKDERLT